MTDPTNEGARRATGDEVSSLVKALQDSERRFQIIFDSAPDAMFLADIKTGAIVDANHTAERLLLRTREDIVGSDFTGLHPPDQAAASRGKFREHVREAQRNGEVHMIEHVALRSDGTTVPVEITAAVLEFEGRQLLLGIFRDIGARRAMEEALRESEERWHFAVEGTNDGIWDWNAVTNEVFFSSRWKEMLGFADDEIENRLEEWDSRVHPDDRDAVYADLGRHLAGEAPLYANEHRIRGKDGSFRWVLDRGKVVSWTDDGRPQRVVGAHTDITARKEAELENRRLLAELADALARVKLLGGLLPICANCKKIRDDQGYWTQIEAYIRDHSEAEFSHGICPECARDLYPGLIDGQG